MNCSRLHTTTDFQSSLVTTVACLDYSVAGGGPLVAYRWDGERNPLATKFVFDVTRLPGHSKETKPLVTSS